MRRGERKNERLNLRKVGIGIGRNGLWNSCFVKKIRVGRKEFLRYLLCIEMYLFVRDLVKNWSILIIFFLYEL